MEEYTKLIDDYIDKIKNINNDLESKIIEYITLETYVSSYEEIQQIDYKDILFKLILIENLEKIKSFDDIENIENKVKDFDNDTIIRKITKYKYPVFSDVVEISVLKNRGIQVQNQGPKALKFWGLKDTKNKRINENNIIEKENDLTEKIVEKVFNEKTLSKYFEGLSLTETKYDYTYLILGMLDSKDFARVVTMNFEPFLNKVYAELSKKLIKNSDFLRITSKIKQAKIELNNKLKTEEKETLSKIKKLKKIKEKLSSLQNNYNLITTMDFNLINEINPNIYKEIYNYVLSLQKMEYDKNLNLYNILKKKNKKNFYEETFQKINIDYKKINEGARQTIELQDDINNLINNLSLLKISSEDKITESLVKTLSVTSNKIINELKYFYNYGIISEDNLIKNIQIIVDDYENFKIKASIIANYQFNESELYNENILFEDKKEIENNCKLLLNYKDNIEIEDFICIKNNYYFDLLDVLIENGIEINSFNEVELSEREVQDLIKRINICNELDIELYSNEEYLNKDFLLGDRFYCNSDELDDYIISSKYEKASIMDHIKNSKRNHIDFNINIIKEYNKLEEYLSEDGLYYDIDDIVISKTKVMRNLTLFYEENNINRETILSSIIYNSNLNDNEVEIISKKILGKNKLKKMGEQ